MMKSELMYFSHFGAEINSWAHFIVLFGLGLALFAGCANTQTKEKKFNAEKTNFGKLDDGRQVYQYTLSNENGFEVNIINYGGIVTSIKAPDKDGNFTNVILGFDKLDKYVQDNPFFGATIGRYANRIDHGKFTLDGKEYQLPTNDGNNHLHGGPEGFFSRYWNGQLVEKDGKPALELSYVSKDGEQGYPGDLDVKVTFSVTEDNGLRIQYDATTDKPTPVNLTNHSYFNLTGDPSTPILNHELTINADAYTPVNDELIPTGEIKPVEGTPFDFTQPHKIGERIGQVEGGYDHNWVLADHPADSLIRAATLVDSTSGRKMDVYTMQPGLQFYSGNFLDGSFHGPDGTPFVLHGALCLETQHFPDSPNEPDFPNTILRPGEKYHTVTEYRFSTIGSNGQ